MSLAEQRALLSWGGGRRVDLPWRHTRDPWAILVSEVMLQQTQAARVVKRYESFLQRWPTPSACAGAALGDVLREWQGLGYPRRAQRLHEAARVIRDDLGGRLPHTYEGLVALAGVGAYTARALLAFAFEADAAVVDTNVARVLARRAGRRLSPREVQSAADALLPPGQAWAWNQAMLDLGATVCTARAWACGGCPLAAGCAWSAAGHPEPDPAHGSAGVSGRQAAYAGSDRQARGRVLAALVAGPLVGAAVGGATGLATDPERAERIIAGLLADGLVECRDGALRLP